MSANDIDTPIVYTPIANLTGKALHAFHSAEAILSEIPTAMIAGGWVRDFFDEKATTPSRDIDLFFTSKTDYLKAEEFLNSRGFMVVRSSKFHRCFQKGVKTYDIVWDKSFDGPEAILSTFDFRCCQVGLTREGWYQTEHFEADVLDRRLVLSAPKRAPFCLYHLARLASKGWNISRDEATRVAKAIAEHTTDEDDERMRQS